MGHASVQVTLDRYGHFFPELDQQVAEGIDRTFRATLRVVEGGQKWTAVDRAPTVTQAHVRRRDDGPPSMVNDPAPPDLR